MLFTDTDRARVATAIADAEATTAGEIVVIVSTESHRYPATVLSVATLLALAVPMAALVAGWSPSALFGDWSEGPALETRSLEALVILQVLVFGAVLALLWFTGLGRTLTPGGLRRDRVHRAALTQFKARSLERTAGRTGVLIYIDEPEHIAEVIADTGIYARVPADHWGTTIAALTAGIKAGRPADGVVAAVALAGDVLATHFPRLADDVNELPDGLIEI
ncbi:TPM domain-containing protein [Polymorphobacter fuscus]|uniref:TPM domain-containing protein n=1 Tax=Sandarakinorhabdus fusca TaxID=1439888 RepID=A0A7C9KWP9_9SPHN|nr:TPM domain-containing protein [Polymorphobacter fuscus]KAB7647874.1 TPM domain-containing protein [Polymorphobacter fuscus]MQT17185.1 TPM domain-containing protein [Polymorphobacter fuscus]NJC08821.1 putative membrane protein [Polymorphobacter fuscus]